MKIDLYHLFRRFSLINLAYPIVLDALKLWAESAGWQVRSSVCKESAVDISSDANVVCFSVYTQTANATYRLAERLRANGKIVILGGPHFRGPETFVEAIPYCDVLVSSICEGQWKELLGAIQEGKIGPNRKRPVLVIDKEKRFRYPAEPFLSLNDKKWFQYPCIPVSMGCPYQCEFCSPYMPGEYVLRDIETICNEVSQVKRKPIWLCDATFGLNKQHTMELMKALAPLKKISVVETSVARMQDSAFIKALALGGVKWVTVGVETLGTKLKKHGTGPVQETLKEIIQRAHDCGIAVQGNFICGLDGDGPESFDLIFDCYQKTKIDSFMLNVLVPYPNTVLRQRLQSEGRIIDSNWEHYDNRHVVYQPRLLTVDQLADGYIQLTRSIYNTRQVITDSLNILQNNGATIGSALAIGHKMSFFYDMLRKERAFRYDNIKGFVSALKIEDIGTCGGRTIYRLEASLVYDNGKQVITVPAGFETDLASVPRLPIVYMMWGDRAHREAVLHDYLYRIDSVTDLPRADCDALFRQAMISRGNPWWIYQPMYWGVWLWGWTGYKKVPVNYKFPIGT